MRQAPTIAAPSIRRRRACTLAGDDYNSASTFSALIAADGAPCTRHGAFPKRSSAGRRRLAAAALEDSIMHIGLDLGTTNSALALHDNDGVRLFPFSSRAGQTATYRSLWHYLGDRRDSQKRLLPACGPSGIESFLDAHGEGRLIQSAKSYLADRAFDATMLFGRRMSLIELLADLVIAMRREAEATIGPLGSKLTAGRPVRFASGQNPDDDLFAEKRLRDALALAGFDDVTFVPEPVAAAYHYEATLDHDELVIVGDFGGGTSDFSLIRVGPWARELGAERLLGNEGVGVAGDALDAQIVHHVVAPRLGMGSTYRPMFGREIEVPVWLFHKLRRWHHLSFLRNRETLELLNEIHATSNEREAIDALRTLLEDNLGFQLHRSVERTKIALSSSPDALFQFEYVDLKIEARVTRNEFESWIARDVHAMETCVDRLLASAQVDRHDVDRVFLTGGTSLVPAVRRLFEDRFGADRIVSGGELISVASGLAWASARG